MSDTVSDKMYVFRFNFKNSIFITKYVRYERNVEMENYLPK